MQPRKTELARTALQAHRAPLDMRQRRLLIDLPLLLRFLGIKNLESLKPAYEDWIEEALAKKDLKRNPIWTESVAVGGKTFIEGIRNTLGIKVIHREMISRTTSYVLREPYCSYFKENCRLCG